MFLDAIFLIAKILAVIAVTIAGVTLLYLLVDFIFNKRPAVAGYFKYHP